MIASSSVRRHLLHWLAPALLVASLQPSALLARDGGGGHGGGGGAHFGGGGYHHVYGGGVRTPALGRNITRDDYNRATNGGHDRFDANRLGWGNRNWNDGDWRGNNWRGNNWGYNNWGNRWNGGWNNNWANGGYWGDRSWSYGWYNWSPNTWGWWGENSGGWGLAGLATGAVITDLVNQASDQQSSVIEVPDSNYQLNYGTVDAVGNSGANFSYSVANSPPVQGGVDCQDGLLDGQVPSTAAQAQLLNAACQVAYGPDPKGHPLPRLWSPSPAVREWLILLLGAGIGFGGYALAKRGQSSRSV
ncbi:MAG: hypothetical protein FJ077_12705 [Cyanobacteria bacterium K_DeepCast_35m_m2_023]|nr:hypothetical protein [Cyanobacteria bacterium K_DeepCast_35m_m2_023]